MVFLSSPEPGLDQFDLVLRRGDAPLRLLLERVQNVNHACEPDSVDCAIRVAIEVVDDLQHAAPAESRQRFRHRALKSKLRIRPITRRTSGGNLRKSLRDDAIHSTGLRAAIGERL